MHYTELPCANGVGELVCDLGPYNRALPLAGHVNAGYIVSRSHPFPLLCNIAK